MGSYQRALLLQVKKASVKQSRSDVKCKATRTLGKTVLVSATAMSFYYVDYIELVDPACETYESSIIDVAMEIGAIIFAGVAEETSLDDGAKMGPMDLKKPVGDERIL